MEATWLAGDGSWLAEPRPCLGKEELFFANKKEIDKIIEAMELCLSCPFREECEELRRVSGSEYGIWAGKSYPIGDSNGS